MAVLFKSYLTDDNMLFLINAIIDHFINLILLFIFHLIIFHFMTRCDTSLLEDNQASTEDVFSEMQVFFHFFPFFFHFYFFPFLFIFSFCVSVVFLYCDCWRSSMKFFQRQSHLLFTLDCFIPTTNNLFLSFLHLKNLIVNSVKPFGEFLIITQ